MECAKCGHAVPEDAVFCPFCGADAVSPPPAPVPPPPPAPAPPPVAVTPPPVAVVPPSAPPPMVAATASAPRRSSPVLAVVLCGCLGLIILLGVGAFFAWHKLAPAMKDITEVAVTPTPVPETGEAPSGEAAGAPEPSTPPVSDSVNLDDFVGTWSFVGEPGPWGEGPPFTLERAGNLLVGQVEIDPMYDDRTRLKLAAGNGEVIGESTETSKDSAPEVHSISMSLNEAKNIITLKYRTDDGEWLMRAAEKKAGGG